MKKSILYFKNQEIDKKKWDHAIRHSVNNIMYAYSWYLDMVSPGWDALIQGDYDVVMPVTWHKKWGVKFLMQPMFAKMLGIFSNQQLGKDVMKEFIDEVKKNIS